MRALLAILAAALLIGATASTTSEPTPTSAAQVSESTATPAAKRNGCKRLFARRHFRAYSRDKFRELVYSKREHKSVRARARCQRTVRDERWAWRKRATMRKTRAWKWSWQARLQAMPDYEVAWARSTSHCESYEYPARDTHREMAKTNTGNGYWGGFQFSPTTALSAGFRAIRNAAGALMAATVTSTSWAQQAVRAIRWKWRTSDEQWPVCGD